MAICEAPTLPFVPPGVNPYPIYMEITTNTVFPPVPLWTFPIITVLGVWRLLMMISCIVIVLIPIWRGEASRRKHFWLFRTRYPPRGRTPYIVPNRGAIIIVGEFCSSGLYLMLASFNYKAFKDTHFSASIRLSLWYGVAWLPSYIGIWLSGWGLCHACLCNHDDDSGRKASRFLTPKTFNWIWSSWAMIVTLANVICAILLVRACDITYGHYYDLQDTLSQAAQAWSPSSNAGIDTFTKLLSDEQKMLKACGNVVLHMGRWYTCWITFGIILALFYIFTVQYLVRMIGRLLRMCQLQALSCRGNTGHLIPGTVTETHTISKGTSSAIAELEKEFRFLIGHSTLISLVLLCEVAVPVFQYLVSRHIESSSWRAGSSIMVMAPSTFISPALLFQSWRLFTEKVAADESQFKQATSEEGVEIQLPIFATEFLGWGGPPDRDPTISKAFSGLDDATTQSGTHSGHDVTITRSVVVLHSDLDTSEKSWSSEKPRLPSLSEMDHASL